MAIDQLSIKSLPKLT